MNSDWGRESVPGGRARAVAWVVWAVAAQWALGVQTAAWMRVLDALAGRTCLGWLSAAAAVLAAFIAGASAAGLVFRKVHAPARFFPALFLLAAAAACLLLGRADFAVKAWRHLLVDAGRTPSSLFALLIGTSIFFFAPAGLLSGCFARMTELTRLRAPIRDARPAAALFLLTCALPFAVGCWPSGGCLAAAAGPAGLTRGLVWAFCVLAVCSVFTARGGRGPFRLKHAALLLAAVALGALLTGRARSRGPKAPLLSSGAFGLLIHRDTGFAPGRPLAEYRSRRHALSLYADPDYRFVLSCDGRPVLFGNRFHTARTLSAYVPLLLRPRAGRAAVVGPEAGRYLPFFRRAGIADLSYARADPLCVRLELAADAFLTGRPDAPAPRPGAALKKGAGYDILFLAPEPVWMRGTCGSYGRGFFRRCRAALATDGIAALHLDTRALSAARFATIARAFLDAFPHAQFWCTGRYDWVLAGAAAPLSASASDMLALFDRRNVSRDFARAGILSLPELFPSLLCDAAAIRPWLDRSPSERAWQSAWRLPRLALGDGCFPLRLSQVEGARRRSLAWLARGTLDEDLYLAIRNKTDRNTDARSLAALALTEIETKQSRAGYDAARDAAKINPRDILITHFVETLELEGRRRIALSEFRGAAKCYENLLAFDHDLGIAHYGMAYCLRAEGDSRGALEHFTRAVRAMPRQTGYRLELAQTAAALGRRRDAEAQYREILRLEPDNPEALFRYAQSLAAEDREDRDFRRAVPMMEKACALTGWRVSEYAFGLADLYMDAGRVMEGMGLKRKLKARGLKRPPRR